MGVRGAHGRRFSLGENFFPPTLCELGYCRDAGWLICVIVYSGKDFIELSGRQSLRRNFLLRAEHNLRPRTDDSSIRSNRVLPVTTQPNLTAFAEDNASPLVPTPGQASSLACRRSWLVGESIRIRQSASPDLTYLDRHTSPVNRLRRIRIQMCSPFNHRNFDSSLWSRN